MPRRADQILTVAQMRAAEEALIAAGSSVDKLMQIAGRGAAEYVWRMAAHRKVTVLCGPGNNGGDGYVIAEAIREWGGAVVVVAATEPKTDAARNARALFQGEVLGPDAEPDGEVLVDCLFGSGLTRPLTDEHFALLSRLARSHKHSIAIDVPSGVESDSGAILNQGLPEFDLTVCLGAWKFAHFLMPASATMGAMRLVGIGCAAVDGAARVITRPALHKPMADAHKYLRGMLGVVCGQMPGAALLACGAAQGAGAGYVKLLAAPDGLFGNPDLVVDASPVDLSLTDGRFKAILVGPGLGRGDIPRRSLEIVLETQAPTVLDADALVQLRPEDIRRGEQLLIATPHSGELGTMERIFDVAPGRSKLERAVCMADRTGMIVVAKGADTVVAAPDGRVACLPRASSWLSVAGTGDVLAGIIASRLATGADPFEAACQGVWLHSEAAHLAGPAFTAGALARAIPEALAACL